MNPALPAAWRAALRERADQPPRQPRVALWAGAAKIGSVEPTLFHDALPRAAIGASGLVQPVRESAREGWQVNGELTGALNELAFAMREAGVAHAWRDEQLAVTDERGQTLGTVERAIVRPLGITTFAVHLIGLSADGRHWVQQRSLTKPNDPGLWDTLVGGMVPAADTLEQALARETWEEAGLRMEQLRDVQWGGQVRTTQPSSAVEGGYVRESIDWYACTVPAGVVPENQDGEVQQFRALTATELRAALLAGDFTLEAAAVMAAAGLSR